MRDNWKSHLLITSWLLIVIVSLMNDPENSCGPKWKSRNHYRKCGSHDQRKSTKRKKERPTMNRVEDRSDNYFSTAFFCLFFCDENRKPVSNKFHWKLSKPEESCKRTVDENMFTGDNVPFTLKQPTILFVLFVTFLFW